MTHLAQTLRQSGNAADKPHLVHLATSAAVAQPEMTTNVNAVNQRITRLTKSSQQLSKNPLAAQTLAARGWLSRQPQTVQRAMLEVGELITVPAGVMLNEIGDADGTVLAMVEGWVNVVIAPQDTAPCLMQVCGPGAWFGDMALLLGFDRMSSIETRTKCKVAVFSEQKIKTLLKVSPEFCASFTSLSAGQIETLVTIIATNNVRDPDARIGLTLLRLIGDGLPVGWGEIEDQPSVPISQTELAEMSLLSRNSVGTSLKKFEDQGAIKVGYKKIQILSRELLRKIK